MYFILYVIKERIAGKFLKKKEVRKPMMIFKKSGALNCFSFIISLRGFCYYFNSETFSVNFLLFLFSFFWLPFFFYIYNWTLVAPLDSRCPVVNALMIMNAYGIHVKITDVVVITVLRKNMSVSVQSDSLDYIANWNYLHLVYWRHHVILL